MFRSNTVVFVSAGMHSPKKRDHILARRQLYLNYGALSLATKLNLAGYNCLLVHGEHRAPSEILEGMLANGHRPSRYPIMLSVPSFYALPWAREFCALAKDAEPDCKIIVGGRWVVGPDPDWLRQLIPEADQMVPGLGEPIIEALVERQAIVQHNLAVPSPEYALNHCLVVDQMLYQPSIEASRGCGMGCQFCEERDIPLERLRPAEEIFQSMSLVQRQYAGQEIHPYMQASLFAPSRRWAECLAGLTAKQRGKPIEWRAETRVDAMKPVTVAAMAAAGLRVIDLGLETASPTQILAMRKSKRPDHYLKSAEELLAACHENGVEVKVNILLYAGETEHTIGETRAWLDEHAKSIKGVSVGPVVAYGPPRTVSRLIAQWRALGAEPVKRSSAAETGITSMHLGPDLDVASAEALSLELSRRYMNADAYFDLKSFSYYPRGYTRQQFDEDVGASDQGKLPFAV